MSLFRKQYLPQYKKNLKIDAKVNQIKLFYFKIY